MTDDPGMSELKAETILAERVRQQLEVFPEKFRELSEGGELNNLLRTHHNLSGPRVEQAPEDFTEQYLIEPVLHGLGYLNPISDDYAGNGPHFVRRPTTFRKIEINRPDYLLKNVSPSTVCILEAKAANREQKEGRKREATDDVEEYVNSNTFAKYLADLDRKYLVAIGTDGLRWTLWVKDVRSGQTVQEASLVDLTDDLKAIARRNSVIEGSPGRDSIEIRNHLTQTFIPSFSARSIDDFVRDQFE